MDVETGLWTEDFCNENDIKSVVEHKYICQKNKGIIIWELNVNTTEFLELYTGLIS